MSLAHGFDWPFNESAGQGTVDPTVAPYLYPVAIGGRGFLVNTSENRMKRYSAPTQRVQTDQSNRPGEQTLATPDLWPRVQQSYHLGAGQSSTELEGASPYRFWRSQGVDPWTRDQLTLLPDATLSLASGDPNQALVTSLSHLFFFRGSGVRIYDGATWAAEVALGGTAGPSTGDGTYAYVHAAGNVKRVDNAGTVTSPWTLASCDVLAFAKGRLIAGDGPDLYDLKPSVAAAVHFSAQWASWVWTAACDGPTAVYVAGESGDRSLIYRVPLKDDGTGLEAPVVAGRLPDGELVRSMTSYLGFFVIGTTKGVRFAIADAGGDLTLGSLVPTDAPVYALEAQDRFVWFGWSDYDAGYTGLGRMDLSAFVDQLTPAYASDLMYEGSGTVSSVVTWDGKLWFSVASEGVIAQSDDLVDSGWVELSTTDYGISDTKVAQFIDLRHDPLQGAVDVWLDTDSTGFAPVATSATLGEKGVTFLLSNKEGERFTIRLVLSKGEETPVLRQVRLRAHPMPERTSVFELPLMIRDTYDLNGADSARDVAEDVDFLIGLVSDGRATTLQMGTEAFVVYPSDYEWTPTEQSHDQTGWQGEFVLQLREVTNG